MPRNAIDSQIQTRIDGFVAEISTLVREAALEAVREALSTGGRGVAMQSRRGRSTPARRTTKKAPRRKSASGKRVRRSPEDLAELGDRFLTYVRAHPGERLEEIGAGLGIDTSELKRPVQLLLASGSLRTTGERRGTRYFANRGGARKTTKRKATRKKKAGRKKKAARRKTTAKK